MDEIKIEEEVDSKMDELELKHGVGRVIRFKTTTEGRLYFLVPTQGDHERYVEKSTAENAVRTVVLREYVLSALQFPSKETMKAIFERWPGMPDVIGTGLIRAAKGGIEQEDKKSR